jgi:hypothetical protein
VVVGKTKMGAGFCIGAIDFKTGTSYRLVKKGANYATWFDDCPFEIGTMSLIEGSFRNSEAPHTEDFELSSYKVVGSLDKSAILDKLISSDFVKTSRLEEVFNCRMTYTMKGKRYFSKTVEIPKFSTAFWRLPYEVNLLTEVDKYFYVSKESGNPTLEILSVLGKNPLIPYVGVEPAIDCIPKNSVVRLSLARWWQPNDEIESRCYLQLSGWFI